MSFTKHILPVEGDFNKLSDTSYIEGGILFVSFYDDQNLYRSDDYGTTFHKITPEDSDDIKNFLGPLLQEGVLNMSAYTKKGQVVLFTSNDMGQTWIRLS